MRKVLLLLLCFSFWQGCGFTSKAHDLDRLGRNAPGVSIQDGYAVHLDIIPCSPLGKYRSFSSSTSLPKAGRYFLTFDLLTPELKDLPISFELLEVASQKRVLKTDPAVYPTGVVRLEATLSEGRYLARASFMGAPLGEDRVRSVLSSCGCCGSCKGVASVCSRRKGMGQVCRPIALSFAFTVGRPKLAWWPLVPVIAASGWELFLLFRRRRVRGEGSDFPFAPR
jgi:hypothetical protein